MNKLIASTLFACVCVGSVLANSPASTSTGPAVADTLKQLERDMGDAMVAVDIDKLDRILADDWKSVGMSGNIYSKQSVLKDLKSGKDRLQSFELGPMDVQVVGDLAAVHGSVTEKRSLDGRDTSGEFVWMDLLERRGGRWVIVRSAGARVKAVEQDARTPMQTGSRIRL